MGSPARATYPGVPKITECSFTIGHGTSPTGFRIITAPMPSNAPLETGTLRLEYNDQVLDFPECKVDRASFRYDTRNMLVEFRILDRRWKWALTRYLDDPANNRIVGRISGEYNTRREDGTIKKKTGGDPTLAIEDSERTPHQLAQLLYAAAGELMVADALNELPNDTRPQVFWDDSNPMAELENLAELLGCRVVLGLDNRVRIRRTGVGVFLPTDHVKRYGGSAPLGSTPDRICVSTDWVRYQLDFPLEAVGLDVDGSRKPINELSYAPAGGWGDLDVLSDYAAIEEETPLNLAIRTVLLEYRIRVPFKAPVFGDVTSLEQIDLLGVQVEKEVIDGVERPRDAMVYGCWYRAYDAEQENSNRDNIVEYLPESVIEANAPEDDRLKQIVPVSPQIDPENWLVRFSKPMYMQTTGNLIGPAKLILRTSCYLKVAKTAHRIRDRHTKQITNAAAPYYLDLRHDEIKPTIKCDYNYDDHQSSEVAPGVTPINVITNAAEIQPEIDHYLDQAYADAIRTRIPQTAEYGGWRFDVELDGAIQSITWVLDSRGVAPLTIIERGHDSGMGGIPYELTRAHQRNADAQRKAAQTEWRTQQTRYLAQARGAK